MNKRALLTSLFSVLLLLASFPVATGAAGIPRPTNITYATIGEPETVDPAWLYDTASATLVQNVYDALIFFNVTRPITPETRWNAGRTDQFIPSLATDWGVEAIDPPVTDPDTGLTLVERWWFEIRTGVKFHSGADVTPEDVEYSLERWMVQCRAGGPTWMILEPTLGIYNTRKGKQDDIGVAKLGKMIDHAVEYNGTHILINFVMPYAPIEAIIAQSWAGILNYDWCVAHDDWPGAGVAFADRWGDYTGWVDYNNPDVSPLDDPEPVMNGAGPYIFDYWDKGVAWGIVAFKDSLTWPVGYDPAGPDPIHTYEYWGGWPAPGVGGQIDTATELFISEWSTRKMMFLAGDVDFVYVPRLHLPEMWLNYPNTPEEYPPGVSCDKDLPTLLCSPCAFFSYNISTSSPFMGVPGGLPEGTFAETGINPLFMSDIDVRKGFTYAFDFDRYIDEVYMGEAVRCPTPIVEGLPFHDPAKKGYDFNLTAAEEHFKAAWGTDVWTYGFKLAITYNTGNVARKMAGEFLKEAVELLHPGDKFHIDVVEVDWPTYLGHLVNFELTLFTLGWLADFPDAHNFAMPFMHTEGDFGGFQNVIYGQSGRMQIDYTVNGVHYGDPTKEIDNAYVDEMIENGVKTTIAAEREVIYFELQQIYVDEVIGFPLCKPTGRHWERDWVHGWYYNPIYPGPYYYHYWKETPTIWTPVDISLVGSITPLIPPIPEEPTGEYRVQTFGGGAYLGGEPVAMGYNLTVHRLDTAAPELLYCIIGLKRNATVVDDEYIMLRTEESGLVEFLWNETAKPETLTAGLWEVNGRGDVVSGERYDVNKVDNEVFDGDVTAKVLVGDLNGDKPYPQGGVVNVLDAIILGKAFGSNPEAEIAPERWNPYADLNGDGKINILDAILLARNFGKTIYTID